MIIIIIIIIIIKYSKLNLKINSSVSTAEPHHQDFRADLQSPSAELLQTLRVGADVLQKLFYWVGVLLTAHIDVHGQVLQYMKILTESVSTSSYQCLCVSLCFMRQMFPGLYLLRQKTDIIVPHFLMLGTT